MGGKPPLPTGRTGLNVPFPVTNGTNCVPDENKKNVKIRNMATRLRLTNKTSRLIALCMSLAITASCTDEEVGNGYAETDVLSFGVSISNEWNTSPETRSATEAQAWNASRFDDSDLWLITSSEQNRDTTLFCKPKTRAEAVATGSFYDSFGVYGYAYEGTDWASRVGVKPYFVAEKVTSKSNGLWMTDPLRYWPGASYRMHFFAYAPYEMATLSVNNNTPELSYTVPGEVTEQKDLVVATADVEGDHNQRVQLPFQHILTAVKMKAAQGMSGTVKKVTLKNINNQGSYTFGESSWTSVTGKNDFELVFNDGITLDPNASNGTFIVDGANTFMMIPQILGTDAALEVTIADGGTEYTLHGSLSGKTDWEIGHTVIYRISKTEINVEYEFSATNPTEYAGEGGTNPVEIRSFKTVNGTNQTPVLWTNAGYYSKNADDSYTELAAPDWLLFPTYQVNQTDYGVKVYPQNGEGTDKTGENSGKIVTSPDKELQKMKETGSASVPVNLAGTDGNETTANCYIVNGPGWYKFPIVYGNALKNGTSNFSAYNYSEHIVNHLDKQITNPWIKDNDITIGSAELRWQDNPPNAPFVDVNSVQLDGDYIKFHIPGGQNCVQGNAVIAVKDNNDKIAWSWHIWVTLHKPNDSFNFGDYSFFNSLLGYREAELVTFPAREVYVKLVQAGSGREEYVHISQEHLYQFVMAGNAPYYQHGRKDPFPGASLEITRDNTTGIYSMKVLQDRLANFKSEKVTSSHTLGYVIQHPDMYIGQIWRNNVNWYWYHEKNYDTSDKNETGHKNLWDNKNTKTVYDPCPAGYKIPSNEAIDFVSHTDKANVEYVNTGIYFINNKNTSSEQRFFLQILGSRGYEGSSTGYMSSYLTANIPSVESNGSTAAQYLLFDPNSHDVYWTSSGTVCQGQCVLPQKE